MDEKSNNVNGFGDFYRMAVARYGIPETKAK